MTVDNNKYSERDAIEHSRLFAQANGMFMRSFSDSSTYTLHTLPYTLLPTRIPQQAYDTMVRLGPIFNKMVDRMARDPQFVLSALAEARKADYCLTGHLCDVLERKLSHLGSDAQRRQLMLGIHRGDYMLHEGSLPQLVEFNTIASGMCGQSHYTQELHRYVMDTSSLKLQNEIPNLKPSESLSGVVDSFYHAHSIATDGCDDRGDAVILFVVQPRERNVFDQKHLEHELWRRYKVKVVRLTLTEIADRVFRDSNDRLFMYVRNVAYNGFAYSASRTHSPSRYCRKETEQRISVVYFRAGYGPADYPTEKVCIIAVECADHPNDIDPDSLHTCAAKEWYAREEIELSNAIKCPTVEYQLIGTKKIQQVWSSEGVLEKFLSADEAQFMRSAFTDIHALDDPTSSATISYALENYMDYVLKPQREGGGNLVYGKRVADMLSNLSEDDTHRYILMRRIRPKSQSAVLVKSDDTHETGDALTEIGIFSIFIG